MSVEEANAFLSGISLVLNKNEFENVFAHFGDGVTCDMSSFLEGLAEELPYASPKFFSSIPPTSPHKAHLALSGVSHIEFGEQYKPFPAHWGAPPNAQMKGHNGIMRELPRGYGKGNAPMAKWVAANIEKDDKAGRDPKGFSPYPYGNYSL